VVARGRSDLKGQAQAGQGAEPAFTAEVVTVGNELLSGRTVDTNFAFLARALEAAGARVVRHESVADAPDQIATAIQGAMSRAPLVVVTGGLGPTPDDVTRKGVSAALGRPLSLDPEILENLRQRWRARGGRDPMPANNELQAMVPRGATVLPNPVGSAPGLLLQSETSAVFVLPGVPSEMEAMARGSIVPWIQARAPRSVSYFTMRTHGIWESVLAEKLGDLASVLPGYAVAFLPGGGGVDVRLRLPSGDGATIDELRERARSTLRERIGPYAFGEDDESLESAVGKLLVQRGYHLAIAESCTGGLLAGRITEISGSSAYFDLGVVCYSNAAKTALAGVPASLIEEHGAVSEQVSRALARGIAKASGAEVGLGVTGIAGPTGGTPEKPVGTVHLAAFAPEGEWHRKLALTGSRSSIRERSVASALDLARRLLAGLPQPG
jgi:competence/damage-inducible protein CinA-like protein